MAFPSLDLERELLLTHDVVIGIDEVGRGALAGPVASGAFFLTADLLGGMPGDLKDSKLVPEGKRAGLAHEVANWGEARVGLCAAEYIDQRGIMAALKAAVIQTLQVVNYANPVILLDGSHNFLADLDIQVVMRTKADRDCGSVAAAAISAKVARDALMVELAKIYPGYGFEENKGYSSQRHIEAIQSSGPSPEHRKSWLTKILADDLLLF
ncbi:MAG: ribonuclease HII [Aquiluna sp.]|nr:ribonuclease HII [Aquiluna sp.]